MIQICMGKRLSTSSFDKQFDKRKKENSTNIPLNNETIPNALHATVKKKLITTNISFLPVSFDSGSTPFTTIKFLSTLFLALKS